MQRALRRIEAQMGDDNRAPGDAHVDRCSPHLAAVPAPRAL